MKLKKKTLAIIIPSAFVGAIALSLAIPFSILGIRTASLKSDYSYLKESNIYSQKVEVSGIELVEQHISCGYASIEMVSSYYGQKITEDELSQKNKGRITTSTSKGFLKEINKSIEGKSFVKHEYLKHDILLKEICISLKDKNPVIVEWAAKYENEWTLHYSVVTSLDISNNNVTIYNPYGYIENIGVDEFINRTSFIAYEKMPGFLNFGFAYGSFDKNTIFFANK
jgi:hypothetical protein